MDFAARMPGSQSHKVPETDSKQGTETYVIKFALSMQIIFRNVFSTQHVSYCKGL